MLMYEVAQQCSNTLQLPTPWNPIYFYLEVFDIEFAFPWIVINNILNCLQDSVDWQY